MASYSVPTLTFFLSLCFPRVTLYAEFLPMKARAKCILLIEVRRVVWVSQERSVPEQEILGRLEPQDEEVGV